MAVLIDTNILVNLERRRELPEILLERPRSEPAFVAAITASELYHGVHRANTEARRETRRRFVEQVLASVNILSFDLRVARVHARIWAHLRSRGQRIGAHDLLIAATALAYGLPLVTENRAEFARVEELDLL